MTIKFNIFGIMTAILALVMLVQLQFMFTSFGSELYALSCTVTMITFAVWFVSVFFDKYTFKITVSKKD